MPTLEERLAEIRESSSDEISEDDRQVMHRVTEELDESGLEERALGEGDEAPAFALPNQDGDVVRSETLLSNGPLVLSFFRGHW